jgi:hypothetical protein
MSLAHFPALLTWKTVFCNPKSVCHGKEENYRQTLTFAGHEATIIVDLMVWGWGGPAKRGVHELFTM